MAQYILLIHGNAKSGATEDEWIQFIAAAKERGFFEGGSEIGERVCVGNAETMKSSDYIVG